MIVNGEFVSPLSQKQCCYINGQPTSWADEQDCCYTQEEPPPWAGQTYCCYIKGRYYHNNLLLPWADAQKRCCHINGEPNPLANPKLCYPLAKPLNVGVGVGVEVIVGQREANELPNTLG